MNKLSSRNAVLSLISSLATYDERIPIDDDTNLFKVRILDSINAIRLVVLIEKEFGFKISPSDLVGSHFETIGSICEFVDSRARTPYDKD
ncbi:MAG: acyl carrier protein [Deltaproteobacteria bacterium]|jgi:methoxymalonate biosynthesis acyl carrier protein|nr:acyl carrier protein [Deltaproteobacteria bacterium]